MADWKGVLRQIKMMLPGTTAERGSRTPIDKQPTQPSCGSKGATEIATSAATLDSKVASKPAKAAHAAPAIQRAAAPTSVSPTPDPVLGGLPKTKGIPATFHSAFRSALTRQRHFKMPERWVADGARTQLPVSSDNAAVDIVIGLDFGTSYTKAAVGLRDQIFPVSWEGISASTDRYLLPTEYSALGDGSCQLGQAPTVSYEQVHQKLKHPFIDPAVSKTSIADASVFVALVLRYIRAWTFLRHRNKIGPSRIRWILNIGAPSNGLENDRLEDAYRRLGAAAWILSQRGAAIGLDDARQVVEQTADDQLPDDLIDLSVLPEFVAQIAGYIQSAQRKSGLHALVDVGGGTLDVVTFIVHEKDGEDVFPFLVPEVRPLGTQMLDRNRLVDAPAIDESRLPDELQPVLGAVEFARTSGLPEANVRMRDRMFWEAVQHVVKAVFHKTKGRRYRLAPAWTDGMPTFLAGGGAKIDGYRESVKDGGECIARVVNLMPLPAHPRLADYAGGTDEYQRISVACGLALDAFTLGHIRPAREVEDDVALRQPVVERPDRDELYAR